LIAVEIKEIILSLIAEAVAKGCRKKKVCEYLNIPIRTIQNWERRGLRDRRKGASKRVHNKLREEEHSEIVEIACSKRFRDITPYEIVPLLAEEGRYIASVSSFYRVLGKAGLVFYSKRRKRRRKKVEPIELKATRPYEIMSWDISWLKTNIKGKYYYLYMFVDIWSRYIVGWQVHEEESGALAKELLNEIASRTGVKGTILHSDNGGPMICSTMRATLEKLEVIASFSRPSVSNDNAYSESLFKTLKYTAGYPRSFKNIEQAREWVSKFVHWYNHEHRHSKIGYVTPLQRLNGLDKEIFARRNETFALARKRNPERWSNKIKVWENDHEVFLKKGNFKRKAS
jgi:transposase InsO family protein